MARRLSAIGWALPSPRRRVQFAALVLAVIGMHSCVTRSIAERMENFATTARMPARIEVAYVRSLEPEAPPVVAPASPPPPSPPRRAPRVRTPRAASAPVATAEAKAASAAESARIANELAAQEAAAAEALRTADAAAPVEPASAPTLAAAASAPPATETAASPSADPERVAGVRPASAPSPSPGAASGEPFEWPASTRVTYVLTGNYRGEVNGNAQVEWIRVGSRYQVNLDFIIGPEFAPIIARRMRSEGDLTADGLAPNQYDEDTQVMFRERRRVRVMFEPDAVVLANGDRRERLRGVQDTASQFVQLTYLFTTRPELLRVGGTVEVPLALPRNVDRWIYDVIAEVEIQTPFGPLAAFHLKPKRVRPMSRDLTAEIWFAPQLKYLPVRIRVEQDPQTFVDLVIARKPELASR